MNWVPCRPPDRFNAVTRPKVGNRCRCPRPALGRGDFGYHLGVTMMKIIPTPTPTSPIATERGRHTFSDVAARVPGRR
jgi:hypothetical protein